MRNPFATATAIGSANGVHSMAAALVREIGLQRLWNMRKQLSIQD
ncbi:MAG TPA: hypothetical protein PLB25_18365 [Rhodoferax sp.]|nr:hypothetical protein [Rhodoferax sp.]